MSNDEVLANQQTILDNQKTIQDNQQEIKANQQEIKNNQQDIKTNQEKLDRILTNQDQIEANQQEIKGKLDQILRSRTVYQRRREDTIEFVLAPALCCLCHAPQPFAVSSGWPLPLRFLSDSLLSR